MKLLGNRSKVLTAEGTVMGTPKYVAPEQFADRAAEYTGLTNSMPHFPGDQLGPYEILAPLGAGGMGEVYKARDTRLDRTVAIKVLPEHIAAREDHRLRFEREARAVASLNHPNICTLHDIGRQQEISYMVMELVDGETLADRIAKGALPLDQALKYATQIADALDRAHRAGVTHRDVKPGNIMLTRDGAKVLDFGLAKSAAKKPAPTDATLTMALTGEGTVLGTPQYMAPELFEGKEADARADIWAFGAVLYEMVTGRKAFEGKSYTSLVGAILSADPAPMAVQPFTPAWLERLTRRCLAKDPEERYHCMRDIVLDLRTPPTETVTTKPASRWPWIAAASVATIAAVIGWSPWLRQPSVTPQVLKLDVMAPDGAQAGGTVAAEISPDGRTLAFISTTDRPRAYVRALDSLAARPLAGTEGATRLFWSPDSKSLAVIAAAMLKRIELATGTATTICNIASPNARGTWSEGDVILLGDGTSSLQQVSASGGTPRPLLLPNTETGASDVVSPQFLPGGREFLLSFRTGATPGVFLGSLDGKSFTPILRDGVSLARYDATSRRILFLQGDAIRAQRLDLDPPRLIGEPVVIASGVMSNSTFSLSRNGSLCYRRDVEWRGRLCWRDRTGKLLETVGPAQRNAGFRLSPDGRRVALTQVKTESEVWVTDLEKEGSSPLIFNDATGPVWSPDGKDIYYTNRRGLYRKPVDGSGEAVLVASGDFPGTLHSVAPDQKAMLLGSRDILALSLSGDAKAQPYLQTPAFEGSSRFSPDGRWVAYDSNDSGTFEVFIQGFPERRGKWQVSANGGVRPEWRADGKELYWVSQGVLTAASVELLPSGVRVGRPVPLFPVESGWYQAASDGRKFLALEPEENQPASPPMTVIVNWPALLKKGVAGE